MGMQRLFDNIRYAIKLSFYSHLQMLSEKSLDESRGEPGVTITILTSID